MESSWHVWPRRARGSRSLGRRAERFYIGSIVCRLILRHAGRCWGPSDHGGARARGPETTNRLVSLGDIRGGRQADFQRQARDDLTVRRQAICLSRSKFRTFGIEIECVRIVHGSRPCKAPGLCERPQSWYRSLNARRAVASTFAGLPPTCAKPSGFSPSRAKARKRAKQWSKVHLGDARPPGVRERRNAGLQPTRQTNDNALVESLNGLRAKCLNAHWFRSIVDDQAKIEVWRRDYNESRPHTSLG